MNQPSLRLPEQNSVTLIGRLTRDPEVRFTAKGLAVCTFDIAVNRRKKDASGNWSDDTSYIPIVVWGDSANRCGERLKKGFPVHVEGRLQSRAWETKEGQKRTTLEVVANRVQFLTKAESGEPSPAASSSSFPQSDSSSTEDEEEIPF